MSRESQVKYESLFNSVDNLPGIMSYLRSKLWKMLPIEMKGTKMQNDRLRKTSPPEFETLSQILDSFKSNLILY